jgi:catechol 2,3-dioxygenase-like lactoylglutathione lyase family enzyme
MHHIDIHVTDIASTRRLFDAVMPAVGYELRSEDTDYVSYWRNRTRPSLGFIADGENGSAMMRIAFAVANNSAVDAAASAARQNGARNIEGPSIFPEYDPDYYAVFFEDPDGNKFEICADAS